MPGEVTQETEAPEGEGLGLFTDLVDVLEEGTTAEDLYSGLRVPFADGSKPTVGELKDFYQRKLDVESEMATQKQVMADERAKLDEAKQQIALSSQTVGQVPQAVIDAQAELKHLVDEAGKIDWPKYEAEDPGEAALTRQKLDTAYRMATQKLEQAQAAHDREQTKAYQDFLQKNVQELLVRVPEWKDESRLNTEKTEMSKYLQPYGYSSDDLNSIVDPRQLHLMRDYMLLRRYVDKSKQNASKVKERGNRVLRARSVPTRKSRTDETVQRGLAQGASKLDKHEAAKALLDQAGFL